MSAYVLVDIEVTESVQYEAYKKLAADTVAAFDGRYVVRGGNVETLEGEWRPPPRHPRVSDGGPRAASGGTRTPTGPPGSCGRPRPART